MGRSLRIGFAGHRPVALRQAGVRQDRLEQALLAAFDGFAAMDRSVRLITGLAMGSDQAAIAAVARLKQDGRDWQVQGVLPCPAALFIALALGDYAAAHGVPDTPPAQAAMLGHWRRVLGQVDVLDTLPSEWRPGLDPAIPVWALPLLGEAFGPCDPPPPQMRLDHSPVARAILGQSDLMLAVWDGSPARGPGGTADMIAMARGRKMPVIIIDPRTGQPDMPIADSLRALG